MTSFSCIWLWKTIFRFYMDVVDNNDFLDVFMYLIVGNNIWILHGCWIIMTSFSCIWLLKTIFTFYMDVVDNNDFFDVFMYLIVGNNIWILHGCCG